MIKINLSLKNRDLEEILKSQVLVTFKNYPQEISFVEEFYVNDDSESDILILFFELEDVDDINRAEKIKERIRANCIIFLSKDETLVFKSLRVNPLQFIRLNNFDEDFKNMIEVLQDYIEKIDRVLTLKSGTAIFRLNVKSIMFIESFGHYLTFHSVNGDYQVRGKISNIIEKIKNPHFIRTHKSFIVNINYVEKVLTDKIILESNLEVPIGRNYRDDVIEGYNKLTT